MELFRLPSAISFLIIIQVFGNIANQTASKVDNKTNKISEATVLSPVGLSTTFTGHKTSVEGTNDGGSRIVNGEPADEGEFPFMVSIQLSSSSGKTYCGGSLMTTIHVLTACQCLSAATTVKRPKLRVPRELFVVAGVTDLSDESTRRDAQKLQCHPRSINASYGWTWDFGMITVDRPFPIEEGFIETKVLEKSLDYIIRKLINDNHECTAIGWGWDSPLGRAYPKILQKVKLNLESPDICQERLLKAAKIAGSPFRFKEYAQICTTAKSETGSTCDGDTGSPLLFPSVYSAKTTLIGIVSWRITCGAPIFSQGVFARVDIAEPWIRKVMAEAEPSPSPDPYPYPYPYPSEANHITPALLTGFSLFTITIKNIQSPL